MPFCVHGSKNGADADEYKKSEKVAELIVNSEKSCNLAPFFSLTDN